MSRRKDVSKVTIATGSSSKIKFPLDLVTKLSLGHLVEIVLAAGGSGNLYWGEVNSERRPVSKSFKKIGCETKDGARAVAIEVHRVVIEKLFNIPYPLVDSLNRLNMIPIFRALIFQ